MNLHGYSSFVSTHQILTEQERPYNSLRHHTTSKHTGNLPAAPHAPNQNFSL
jgi:hypothetical protein